MMLVAEPSRLSSSTNHEQRAFGDLFAAHAQAIYTYCFRCTADWSAAEDLTSVVFLQAWRRRHDVDLSSQPALPWLYGIATNVLRNHRRALRRHRAALQRVPDERAGPEFAEDAASRVADERRMRDLLTALAALSSRDREVLALCTWQGLSYEDAAAALSIPIGTVRSRLARARERLALNLAEEAMT